MRVAVASALVLAIGCGGEDAARPTASSTEVPATPTPTPAPTPTPSAEPTPAPTAEPTELAPSTPRAPDDDELLDLLAPARPDEFTDLPEPRTDLPPPHGCVPSTSRPYALLRGAGPTTVLAHEAGLFFAAYVDETPERIAILRLAPNSLPEPFATTALDGHARERTAPPRLARFGPRELGVALVESSGAVKLGVVDPTLPASALRLTTLAEGADLRFSPALLRVGSHRLVAYVEGGTPMRVRLVRLGPDGAVVDRRDLTPEAGGATAPMVPAGLTTSALYFLDAREALSVVHRVGFEAEGVASPATVVRPINLAADPASFAIVERAGGGLLAYAAVGRGATRAVGLHDLPAPGAAATDLARPLVPGLGYGAAIRVSGAALGDAAVFAMEAPSAPAPTAPHEVRVRVVAADGTMGEPLVLPDERGPEIAATEGGATVVTRGAHAYFLRCSP